MAEGLNRVMLLGNLGQDPELKFTQSGQAMLKIRLATTETYFDRDKQKKERTEWHTVVVWGRRAEALGKILTKGSSIFVEGSIQSRSYEGRDGQKRYATDINARNVVLVGGRGGSRGGGGVGGAIASGASGDCPPPDAYVDGGYGGSDAYGPGGDDDLPF